MTKKGKNNLADDVLEAGNPGIVESQSEEKEKHRFYYWFNRDDEARFRLH